MNIETIEKLRRMLDIYDMYLDLSYDGYSPLVTVPLSEGMEALRKIIEEYEKNENSGTA